MLPVPLTRWALLDERQRAAVRADWEQALGERAEPVPIAERTVDELEANVPAQVTPVGHRSQAEQFALMAEAAMRAYVRIDQLTNGFAVTPEHPYMRPAYVHEASALIVQGAAIHRGQGLAETIEFLRFLADSELPQATMWQRHLELAMLQERPRSSDDDTSLAAIRRMLTITVWCMLGAYPQDGRSACPASRFGRLRAGLVSDPRNGDWSCDVDDPGSIADRRGTRRSTVPGLSVLITRRTPTGELYASGFAYPMESATPARLKELDRKLELESRMQWCDLAFSSLSVPDQIVASSRRGLEELTGKRVLQIV